MIWRSDLALWKGSSVQIKFLIFLPLALLLLLSGFVGGKLYLDYSRNATIDAAKSVFKTRYPDSTLIALGEIDDSWIYRYMDGDQLIEILRLGNDWLKVQRP